MKYIKTFFFDLYGTLVDIRTDEEKIEVFEKLSSNLKLLEMDYEKVYEFLK